MALCTGLVAAQTSPDQTRPVRLAEPTGHTPVDQRGAKAAAIRKTLADITLPAGFKVELYAVVPNARHMAMAPDGRVLIVGTRKSRVWAVTDLNTDNIVDDVREFAPSLNFDVPNGVVFGNDGTLFVAERNRVLMFADAGKLSRITELNAVAIVPEGALIPAKYEGRNHTSRVIKIGPDNKLYISLGQPYNVTPLSKINPFSEIGIGGIIRMNRDGSNREVYTDGIRNSVGHDFHPVTGDLWFTDNQVDGMGDDIPPGELNHQIEIGQHFGFPWFGGGAIRTKRYAKHDVPVSVTMPAVETVAHAADLGMSFYTGNMFPAVYSNAIFSAQHGSWNRTTRIGARVMVTFIDDAGNAGMKPFAQGWLNANGAYEGRPVDVIQIKDGSLLVSDDFAGAIYRISYSEPNTE